MNKQNKKPRSDEMYKAILTLKTVDECKRFFDDLCTVTELRPWSSDIRWPCT